MLIDIRELCKKIYKMTPFISYYYDKNPLQSKFCKECSLNLEKQLNYFGYKLISGNIKISDDCLYGKIV